MTPTYSGILFARPSFLEGMARVLDFGNTLTEYNTSVTPQQADAVAIAADWRAVGDDIRSAIREFEEQHPAAL